MGFLDDAFRQVQTAAPGLATDIQSNVQRFIQSRISEPLIKIGALPSGNLNEAQIRAGMRGAPPPIVPAAAQPQQVARSEGDGQLAAALKSLPVSIPVLVVVGLGVFLILKRK